MGGDLLLGSGNSPIATRLDRSTRFVTPVKDDRKAETAVDALIEHARQLRSQLYLSLAWEGGKTLTGHRRDVQTTGGHVDFCDPQRPWPRGANEYTLYLPRQYIPKDTDVSGVTQAQLDDADERLNERSGRTLSFETPIGRYR